MIPLMSGAFTLDEELVRNNLANFVLNTKRFSMGEKCLEFESAFANHQKRKYCVLFNSGSSANLALLQSLKNLNILKNNDNIGVSALTWATNVMPIIQLGMNPIPIDCNINSLNVMTEQLLERTNEVKLDCLFITNALGFAGDLDKIKEYCQSNNIIFIEDNCESLGSEIGGIKTGNFGLASTFSFFASHHLSTIEGGAVCTDDKELSNMLIMARAHGWTRNLPDTIMEADDFYSRYTFYDLAYNLRPTEITGFLGLLQINSLDETYSIREKNFNEICSFVKDDIFKINVSHQNKVSNFAFPIICKNKESFYKYINRFNENDVEVRPIIGGNIQDQPFYRKYITKHYDVPNTKLIHNNGFYFANNITLNANDMGVIKKCLT